MEQKQAYYLALDVGGTHVTAALVDSATYLVAPESESRQELDTHADAEVVIDAFADLCKRVCGGSCDSVLGIGFAMPGPFDYANGIFLLPPELRKYERCYNVNLKSELADKLKYGGAIGFINDAVAFGVGECCAGSAKDYERVIAIALGTGFGAALLVDGKPGVGVHGAPQDGLFWNQAFRSGVADDFFSTRGITNMWQEISGEKCCDLKALATRASTGDAQAVSLFAKFGSELGEFLAPRIAKLHIQAVVLGGGVGKTAPLFIPSMATRILQLASLSPDINISQLDERAQLIGAVKALSF